MTFIKWQNCYDDGWDDLIVKEAFAHPAKFSYGLIRRIIETGIARGYWQAGDLLGDPFGGIASGGIVAGYHGLSWIGCELESRFVELGNRNLALHRRQHAEYGASCRLLQGDSRDFAAIVGEVAGIVTSPPYEQHTVDKFSESSKRHRSGTGRNPESPSWSIDGYGTSPGNIGNLKSGSVDAVVTSPPYAESVKGAHGETESAAESRDKRQTPGGSLGQSARHGGYGVSEGQIGKLKEGSVDAVVTSPQYEGTSIVAGAKSDLGAQFKAGNRPVGAARGAATGYGEAHGQLGNASGETYWQAMALVYEQCRIALKPGGYMAVVIKDYIKAKKRVPLCDQTVALLESLGFDVFERVHAMLVKEESHPSLFGGEETKKKERKSFFRRLAEKKGSPPIDYEEVIFCKT